MRICRWIFVFGILLFPLGRVVSGQTVTCFSDDGMRHYCKADTSRGVTLVKQPKNSPCKEGSTWGFDEGGIWVDKGCGADFALGSAPAKSGVGLVIPCTSQDGEKHYCEADTRHGARLVRQRSQAPCKEGESWGYDEEGIWVDKGCGGDFTLGRGAASGDLVGAGGGQTTTCSSEDGRRKLCPADTRGGVQLARQLGDAKCKEGSSWGHDDHGIWVDKGCQADFVVGVPGHPAGSGKGAEAKNQRIACSSDDGRKNYCDADTQGAKVQLVKQEGAAACMEGSTWGFDRKGIWVDRGCRGEFLVQAGGDAGGAATADTSGKSCTKTVGKQVANELVKECLQVSPATHPPCNAQNACEMIREEIRRSCAMLGTNKPAFCELYP